MTLEELNLNEEQLEGVKSFLQSEGDKIRTKYNKEIKELKEKVPKELTDEEKAYNKEKEDFKREKMQFELSKNLTNKGLDSKLAQYLNVQGVEDLETYISDFSKIVGANNSFKPNSHSNAGGSITKEQFNNMGYKERENLYNTNKELYTILSK
ncbi:hypothetical protein [Clostridium sp. BJN0001]|uniref:hypothetical protein n=1 Tax=Clostridium sp. BJN0001 TaxID=2930219 RepID=UPI001FD3DB82|nr:hypothetical protein [Clostridium sp. BJN0001]